MRPALIPTPLCILGPFAKPEATEHADSEEQVCGALSLKVEGCKAAGSSLFISVPLPGPLGHS